MRPSIASVVGKANWLTRLLAAIAFVPMGGILVWRLLKFLGRARWALGTTQGLDYGEGIVWQQLQMISDGRGYAPFQSFPAIVFHYPPLYHVMTWFIAAVSGVGDLVAGRALSIVSTLIAAICVGVTAGLVTRGSSLPSRWICGTTAFLAPLSCFAIVTWGPFMRVDMLAAALSLGGLCLTILSLRRPLLIYCAAIAFVGAVYTKQTMLAAPGAAFLVLLFARPRLALRGIGACVGLGLIILAGLLVATRGEFLHHIFGYNLNRFSFSSLRSVAHVVRQQAMYLLAAFTGFWLCIWQLARPLSIGIESDLPMSRADNDGSVPMWIAMAYAVAATFFLVLVGKSGSSINYYIEWFFAVGIFVGVSVRPAADALIAKTTLYGSGALAIPLLLLPLLAGAGALYAPTVTDNDKSKGPGYRAELQALMRMLQRTDRPVISDNMVVLREVGKEVVLEPAIVAELTATKVYDERPLIGMIHNKEFGFFITEGGRGDYLFTSRYSPAVTAAMYQDYPHVLKLAGMNVHLPAVSPDSHTDR